MRGICPRLRTHLKTQVQEHRSPTGLLQEPSWSKGGQRCLQHPKQEKQRTRSLHLGIWFLGKEGAEDALG